MSDNKLMLWQPEEVRTIPANINEPKQILMYAKQLSRREKDQIISGFEAQNYEIVVNFIWVKAMSTLKRELATVGVKFLGEMLGKINLSENEDIASAITDKEAIKLAEELGVVASTEAIRLRQTQELLAHFFNLDSSEADELSSGMEGPEAIMALRTCVKNILGKPKISIATEFTEFRNDLESKTFNKDDKEIRTLLNSPYFFNKLTISILLSSIKEKTGAKLEHALANINLLLPLLWGKLRDAEKWQVGHTYAELNSAGQSTAMGGLGKALLKVKGFDFVPENLRSDTFIKAAENVLTAHDGMNNFHTEASPMNLLSKLGSTIPTPALFKCMTAILSVRLGNSYGASFSAVPIAEEMLNKITMDRWEYYMNQCFPGDIKILDKLFCQKPRSKWFDLVIKYKLDEDLNLKDLNVRKLISASVSMDHKKTEHYANLLRIAFYGKR